MLHIQIGCLQLYLPPLPLTSMLSIFNLSLSPSCCLCKTLASSLSRVTQHAKFAGSRIKVRKPKRSTDRDNKGGVKESRESSEASLFRLFFNTALMEFIIHLVIVCSLNPSYIYLYLYICYNLYTSKKNGWGELKGTTLMDVLYPHMVPKASRRDPDNLLFQRKWYCSMY